MNPEIKRRINESWDKWEIIEPDLSTEQIIHRVAQECGVDESTVAEAIDQ